MNICELPTTVRDRAERITRSTLAHPNNYLQHRGKRLQKDRSMIVVPVGGDWRLLFRDHGRHVDFAGAYSHNEYDRLITRHSGRTLPTIAPVYTRDSAPNVIEEQQPVDMKTEEPKRTFRRNKKGSIAARVYLRTVPVGEVLSAKVLADKFGIASNSTNRMFNDAIADGFIKESHKVGRVQFYVSAKTICVTHDEPVERIVDRILSDVASLADRIKPCKLDTFSRAELVAELMRRESAA